MINLDAITAALPQLEASPLVGSDRFEGRTLFLLGGKSRYVVPADHAGIRGHFPAVKIDIIADSGHNPHMQSRDNFVARVRDWTQSTP